MYIANYLLKSNHVYKQEQKYYILNSNQRNIN